MVGEDDAPEDTPRLIGAGKRAAGAKRQFVTFLRGTVARGSRSRPPMTSRRDWELGVSHSTCIV